jgi:alpha-beta hydrolase superfamily lysophospholipase
MNLPLASRGHQLALAALAAAAAMSVLPVAAATRVTLRTDDGVQLAATWFEPSSRPAPAVILVHMLHRSRREWDALAQRFASEGIGALAIDLRGHGESGGAAPTAADGNPDYSSMLLDLKAARRHLAQRPDVHHARIGIVGASLGANLAVLEASADAGVASLALLSPSLDYRGLRIEAPMRRIAARPVLLVASDDDPYASRSVRELQKAGTGPREILVVKQAGHGTAMLARDPDLVRTLVDWFRRTLL